MSGERERMSGAACGPFRHQHEAEQSSGGGAGTAEQFKTAWVEILKQGNQIVCGNNIQDISTSNGDEDSKLENSDGWQTVERKGFGILNHKKELQVDCEHKSFVLAYGTGGIFQGLKLRTFLEISKKIHRQSSQKAVLSGYILFFLVNPLQISWGELRGLTERVEIG